MKKLLSALLLLSCFQLSVGRTLIVTSSSDNVNMPTPGMLRYFIKNTQTNDTITFNVSTVKLAGSINLSNSIFIDGGPNKVTIDGSGIDNIFSASQIQSPIKIVIKNLHLTNGKVQQNYASGGAMLIYVMSGEVIVDNCIFTNNEVRGTNAHGGALYALGGTFINCFFISNKASGQGGAVSSNKGLFINCIFSGNQTSNAGGGVSSSYSNFYNCTFAYNKTTLSSSSAGINIINGEMINCIAYGNISEGGKSSNIYNEGGKSSIKHCAMESGNALLGTNGNIGLTSSPFKGGKGADSLSIVDGSCVNWGTTIGVTVLSADIIGNKRITGTAIDLGAYEFNSSPITSVVSAFTYNSTLILYPNPSKGVVYLNSKMLNGDHWELEVYDLLGHLVLSAPNATFFTIPQAGIYQVKVKSSDTIYSNKIVVE